MQIALYCDSGPAGPIIVHATTEQNCIKLFVRFQLDNPHLQCEAIRIGKSQKPLTI